MLVKVTGKRDILTQPDVVAYGAGGLCSNTAIRTSVRSSFKADFNVAM